MKCIRQGHRRLANKIWEIKDNEIKEFKGNYEEWVAWNERMAAKSTGNGQQVSAKEAVVKKEKPASGINGAPPTPKQDKSVVQKELQKQQKIFQKLEKDVENLNTQKAELEAKLSHPDIYANAVEFKKTEAAYKDVTTKLNEANKEYEIVFEKIISLDEALLNT